MTDARALSRPPGQTRAASLSFTEVKCPACGCRHYDAPPGTVLRVRCIDRPADAVRGADVVKCRRCKPVQFFEVVRPFAPGVVA